MTKQEARAHFKLRDTDRIDKKGVQELLELAQRQAKYYRLESCRKEAQKDIEACKALLEE